MGHLSRLHARREQDDPKLSTLQYIQDVLVRTLQHQQLSMIRFRTCSNMQGKLMLM